jgi:hypothetical protein
MQEPKLKQLHPKQLSASPSPNFSQQLSNQPGLKLLNPASRPIKRTIASMCELELALILAESSVAFPPSKDSKVVLSNE